MSQSTYTVPQAAALLGISKTHAYKAIKDKEFPFPFIKIGNRYLVAKRPLDEALGNQEVVA